MSMQRDNFRANQPPSKVLHVRNLPPEATEDEVLELCRPFGRVVKVKTGTGQQGDQAFVQFDNVQSAMRMIYHFVGNADPPKVRNKAVYLQYSTRQEISGGPSGGGGGGEATGCVLLCIMDNIQIELGPTLETIHAVFSAFGDVFKIAMFEKQGGLQALVQFHDPDVARQARAGLDGRSIPTYLLPSHPGPVHMKVNTSAHSDLQVRSQGPRSRDFVNLHLPAAPGWAPPAGIPGQQAPTTSAAAPVQHAYAAAAAATVPVQQAYATGLGYSATGYGPAPGYNMVPASGDGCVVLLMIDDVVYPLTVSSLHTIVSTYGRVAKMTIFEKSGNWQALVQFTDPASAAAAKQSLDGFCMYADGANKLKTSFSVHRDLNVRNNGERSWDFTSGGLPPPLAVPTAPGGAPAAAARSDGAAAGPATGRLPKLSADNAAAAVTAGGAAAPSGLALPPELDHVITGPEYEHAHEEVARAAAAALGGSTATAGRMGGHPRPPVHSSYGGFGGPPPPAPYGYAPPAPPAPGYGYGFPRPY